MSSYEDRAGTTPDAAMREAATRRASSPALVDPQRFHRHSHPAVALSLRKGFTLGDEIDRWNAWTKCQADDDDYGPPHGPMVLNFLRERLAAHMARDLHGFLNEDELRLWLAIYGKTLGSGWLVEKISFDMFEKGHRDSNGELWRDGNGLAYMRRATPTRNNIGPALESLWRKRQIEAFEVPWKGNVQRVYLPCSLQTLAAAGEAAYRRVPSVFGQPTLAKTRRAQLRAEVRLLCEAMYPRVVKLHPEGRDLGDPAFDPLRLFQADYDNSAGVAPPEEREHHRARTRRVDTRKRLPAVRRAKPPALTLVAG